MHSLFLPQLDLSTTVLRQQDGVTFLDSSRYQVPCLVMKSWSNSHYFPWIQLKFTTLTSLPNLSNITLKTLNNNSINRLSLNQTSTYNYSLNWNIHFTTLATQSKTSWNHSSKPSTSVKLTQTPFISDTW